MKRYDIVCLKSITKEPVDQCNLDKIKCPDCVNFLSYYGVISNFGTDAMAIACDVCKVPYGAIAIGNPEMN
jgi:hypothetical protein